MATGFTKRGGKYRNKSNSKKYTIKSRKECCEATFIGLHKWYVHMFEHLGWMLLAKTHGHMEKVEVYKQSLKRLKIALEERINFMNDVDRKQDLQILHKNLNVLISHTNKDFP